MINGSRAEPVEELSILVDRLTNDVAQFAANVFAWRGEIGGGGVCSLKCSLKCSSRNTFN